MSEQLLKQLGIEQQILQQMVDERAALAEAERVGIDASDEEVRQRILASIERIAKGIATAAGVPDDRAPILNVIESENAPSLYNDPQLSERLANAIGKAIGPENVIKSAPLMASEDFGVLNLDHKIPSFYFWLGAMAPEKIEASRKSGKPLPSLHSSLFEPLPEPTIRTGVKAMTTAVLELMKK